MFNSFLNIYLRIFYSSFPPIRTKSRNNKNNWITLGIKTSCKCKRELFLLCRNSNNPELKQYYNTYCKILVNVIKEAERTTYNKRIIKSNNKSKTTCNIISESTNDMQKLTVEGSHLTNQHDIADEFNDYFTSIIDKINSNYLDNIRDKNSSSTYSYLEHSNGNQYSSMVFKSFSTKEIISIIKSLKTKNSSGYDEINIKLLKISVLH